MMHIRNRLFAMIAWVIIDKFLLYYSLMHIRNRLFEPIVWVIIDKYLLYCSLMHIRKVAYRRFSR